MVFLIGVLYALVSGLTTVFVVPLMIQADSGVLAAWRRLWGSIKTAWKQYLAYVVIAFLLTVAAGIIASIVVGIVAIVLLIPILIVAAITHVTVSLSSTVGIAVPSHSHSCSDCRCSSSDACAGPRRDVSPVLRAARARRHRGDVPHPI